MNLRPASSSYPPLKSRRLGFRSFTLLAVLASLGLVCFGPGSQRVACAQVGFSTVPPPSYFVGVSMLYSGDYSDALQQMKSELRGGIKTAESSWIDSICFLTMTGECYYHMGKYQQALESYTAALKLYSGFSDWMIRVRFPGNIQVDNSSGRIQIPWGRSTRQFKLGTFPDTMSIAQGSLDANLGNIIQNGIGAVQKPVFFPVNVQEIVRCTSLAMSRRRELMGPLCKLDPLTAELLAKLTRRPGPQNWSEAWIDLQLGLAHAAAGENAQAEKMLTRSILVAGEFDHPLTCVALNELGKIALEAGDFNGAGARFEEATYSAVYFNNPGVLQEAFELGFLAHVMANKQGVYPPLAVVPRWAKAQRMHQLSASAGLLIVENLTAQGDGANAYTALGDARALVGRGSMAAGTLGAQLNYLTALVSYQRGQPKAAVEPLNAVLNFARAGGSKWAFQVSLADKVYVAGGIEPRDAVDLYRQLLRDPTPADWRSSPFESISILSLPHPLSYELWFDAALKRKEIETALLVADMARRHRFFSTLELGGRLLALRGIMETPADQLSKVVALQQQDLRVRYPNFDKLNEQAKTIQTELAGAPLIPGDEEAKKKQKSQLEELAKIGLTQEFMLREMALRREPADMIFPPIVSVAELQGKLPAGQAVLVFFSTSRGLHAFLINHERYGHWVIASEDIVQKGIAKLLRELGNHDANKEVSAADLANQDWKKTASSLMEYLLKGSQVDLSQKIDELSIVPDGSLWYLPFEILPIKPGVESPRLHQETRIRYAPTLGLLLPDNRPDKPLSHTAVAIGKLAPKDPPATAEAAFELIKEAMPTAQAIHTLDVPSALYRVILDQLIVLADLEVDPAAPYGWVPLPLDVGKNNTTGALTNWLPLPWGIPDLVVLPGFHTAAENGLKKKGNFPPGQEVFLSVTALMSGGARTILLSRWRLGGQTSIDLVREFVQELPYDTAAASWHRSIALAQDRPVNPELEPRISSAGADPAMTAAHPFFWSGYLLVDTGKSPIKEEAPKDNEKPKIPKLKPVEVIGK
jgi:tetratricopeptide (TPR) repeat protein